MIFKYFQEEKNLKESPPFVISIWIFNVYCLFFFYLSSLLYVFYFYFRT